MPSERRPSRRAVTNSPQYRVTTTKHFDRLLNKLAPKHPDLSERLEETIAILSADPYNRSRRHPIKKLEGVPPGEGQYRLRSGRFRFRYGRLRRVPASLSA